MSQPSLKMPRLLMHRDIAELLKRLPDRHFPYRIFDAASGRVLRSVSGEEESWAVDERVEAAPLRPRAEALPRSMPPLAPPTPMPPAPMTPTISVPPTTETAATHPPSITPAMPGASEVPAPAHVTRSPSFESPLRTIQRGAAGAVAAAISAASQARGLPPATRDSRSVLGSLRAPLQPSAPPNVRTPSVAHRPAIAATATSAPRQRLSAAQVLTRLAHSGDGRSATGRQSAASILATIVSRSNAGPTEETRDASQTAAQGSAASILRGALRR